MSRRDARERAFQLLYQLSVQADDVDQQIGEFMTNMSDYHDGEKEIIYSDDERAYIQRISGGFRFYLERLDNSFTPFLKDWAKERLPKVDLAILRLAACEILFMPEVPLNVSINEAVLLAKKYSTPESRSYINGVLGKIVKPEGDILQAEILGEAGVKTEVDETEAESVAETDLIAEEPADFESEIFTEDVAAEIDLIDAELETEAEIDLIDALAAEADFDLELETEVEPEEEI